jgi:RimJ/RimL family protein N-acetyltransferase
MMGIFIAKEYQGHGYGPEAIKWAVEWAFQKAGLHRVGLEVYGYNTKALKIYKDLGFVNEGGARDALWYDGKWWDKVYMGILADEWEKIQEKGST